MKRILSILLLLTLPLGAVQLAWDPSPDSWVTGYRLYCATNSFYGTNDVGMIRAIDVGTNLTTTVYNFQSGTYYFVATAYTTNGLESLPSNEVSWTATNYVAAPGNMRIADTGEWHTVVIQFAVGVTNPFVDVGLFRLRIP